jgi:hypothetical protein
MTIEEDVPIIEPFMVGDVYATELARVEDLGSAVRLVFTVPIPSEGARHVVARLILPKEVAAMMTDKKPVVAITEGERPTTVQ